VLEKKLAKAYLDQGCATRPGNVSDTEKVKHKTKCVGGMAKTNKAIPTLRDSQCEKLFQSAVDKSLEKSIGTSKKLMHRVKTLQENSELLLVSENAVSTEPAVARGGENSEMQGVRKIESKSKEKKVNKLSRKSKTLTNSHDINKIFTTFRQRMTKKIKKLEKETTMYGTRWESSSKALLDMAEEKTLRDKEFESLQGKIQILEKLCRALQTQRNDLNKKVQDLSAQSTQQDGKSKELAEEEENTQSLNKVSQDDQSKDSTADVPTKLLKETVERRYPLRNRRPPKRD